MMQSSSRDFRGILTTSCALVTTQQPVLAQIVFWSVVRLPWRQSFAGTTPASIVNNLKNVGYFTHILHTSSFYYLVYLDVPSSVITPTDVQLMFNFPSGTVCGTSKSQCSLAAPLTWVLTHWFEIRTQNFVIKKLFCLAPTGCLQYFTAATGRVKSFNWQDVAVPAAPANPRQLNNQNYNMCFRTEFVSGSVRFSFFI